MSVNATEPSHMSQDTSRLRLSAALKTYPHTSGLKSGAIADPSLELVFNEVEPIHRAFAPMARTQAFDVSELAIVTYLQAKAYNKPLVLLPAVVAARFQQGCIIYNARRGKLSVNQLAGARIGVRAYSQTTGMWVRAILAQTYSVPIETIDWVAFEGAHLQEYHEPSFVRRAAPGKELLPMLRAGELDAVILGNDLPDEPGLETLIPDAAAADAAWYALHRYVPINHVVVMKRETVQRHPRAMAAVYELLKRGKASMVTTPGSPDKLMFGINALRAPLEETLNFCAQQKLLPRELSVDEIFADCIEFLGDAAL
jgi:4,5-dihydroxyphthalate decarboxylase